MWGVSSFTTIMSSFQDLADARGKGGWCVSSFTTIMSSFQNLDLLKIKTLSKKESIRALHPINLINPDSDKSGKYYSSKSQQSITLIVPL